MRINLFSRPGTETCQPLSGAGVIEGRCVGIGADSRMDALVGRSAIGDAAGVVAAGWRTPQAAKRTMHPLIPRNIINLCTLLIFACNICASTLPGARVAGDGYGRQEGRDPIPAALHPAGLSGKVAASVAY